MKNRSLMHAFAIGCILLAATLARAANSDVQEFRFKFEKKAPQESKTMERWEYKTRAGNYETAFKEAALECYKHFKRGRPLSEDEGLDIIDICANPRG